MIALLIILTLAFTWLLKETDYLRVRLESTESQRIQLVKVKMANSAKADIPEGMTPVKPLIFTPLDMPDLTGSLNIICERGNA